MNDKGRDEKRGERLRRLMAAGGWEIKHLADEVGVHESRVHAWLKGETIGSRSLSRLEVLLHSPRLYIVSGIGPKFIGQPEGVDVEEVDRQATAEKADRQADRRARRRRA